MVEELEPASIALVVDWCWGLHVREGGVLLRVGVLRVVVVVIGGEGLLVEWVLHGVNWRLRVGRAAVEELLLETIETGSEIGCTFWLWVGSCLGLRDLSSLKTPSSSPRRPGSAEANPRNQTGSSCAASHACWSQPHHSAGNGCDPRVSNSSPART